MSDNNKSSASKQRKLTEMFKNSKRTNKGSPSVQKNTLHNEKSPVAAECTKSNEYVPVSLNFFKKHTHYEEMIDSIIRAAAKGDEGKYKQLINNDIVKENALKNYYKAFYLKPKIRQQHPIQLKPMPKRIKDQLLQIPVKNDLEINVKNHNNDDREHLQSTCIEDVATDDSAPEEEDTAPSCQRVRASKRLCFNANEEVQPKRLKGKSKETDASAQQCNIPLVGESMSKKRKSTKEHCDKQSTEVNTTKANHHFDESLFMTDKVIKRKTSAQNCNELEAQIEKSTIKESNEQHCNEPLTDNIHMKDLQPFEHCCPITYAQFKKFTNIKAVVAEHFAKKPTRQWPYFMKKTYLLFYLKSTLRSTSPLKDIKMADSCPDDIKQKFYDIPEIYQNEELATDNNNEQSKTTTKNVGVVIPNSDTASMTNNMADDISNGAARDFVEILEHRIIPPIASINNEGCETQVQVFKPIQREPLAEEHNLQSVVVNEEALGPSNVNSRPTEHHIQHSDVQQRTPNQNNCIFCHFSLNDFIKCTNVVQTLAALVTDVTELSNLQEKVRVFYKKYLTKRLEPHDMDKVTISLDKVELLLKYRDICSGCLNLYQLNDAQNNTITPQRDCNAGASSSVENDSYVREGNSPVELETMAHEMSPLELEDNLKQNSSNKDQSPNLSAKQNEPAVSTQETCKESSEKKKQNNLTSVDNITDQLKQMFNTENRRRTEINNVQKLSYQQRINNLRKEMEKIFYPERYTKTTETVGAAQVEELELNVERANLSKSSSADQGEKTTECVTSKISSRDDKKSPGAKINPKSFVKYCKIKRKVVENITNLWKCVIYLPVDYNTFKRCTVYNETLNDIIKSISSNDAELMQKIANDAELCELLLKEYYIYYFTNSTKRNKFPIKLKSCPALIKEKMSLFMEDYTEPTTQQKCQQQVDAQDDIAETTETHKKDDYKLDDDDDETVKFELANHKFFSGILSDEFLLHLIGAKHQDPTKQHIILEKIKVKYPSVTEQPAQCSKDEDKLEKVKSSLLCQVDKTHTLSYVLRTRHGLKHTIVRAVMEITFNEFQDLVHIYDTDCLKSDENLMKSLYDYVTTGLKVWPTNLYINLKDFFAYLKKKNIQFPTNDGRHILEYISPKFLHWMDLRDHTNFIQCVNNDYGKSSLIKLDMNNEMLLVNACENYYNRCWKYDEWLWTVPLIKDDLLQDLDFLVAEQEKEVVASPSSPMVSINEVDMEENLNPSADVENLEQNAAAVVESVNYEETVPTSPTANIVTANENQTENVNNNNFISVPNTQQQIDMLPNELSVAEDPLIEYAPEMHNSDDQYDFNVEPAAMTSNDEEVKAEPVSMLHNLHFYLDDNGDMFQCSPINSEPIIIDDSYNEESLDLDIAGRTGNQSDMCTVNNKENSFFLTANNSIENNTNLVQSTLEVEVNNSTQDHILAAQSGIDAIEMAQNVAAFSNESQNYNQLQEAPNLDQLPEVLLRSNGSSCKKMPNNSNKQKQKESTSIDIPGCSIFSNVTVRKKPLVASNRVVLSNPGTLVPQLSHDFRALPVKTYSKRQQSALRCTSQELPPPTVPTHTGGSSISQELAQDCTLFNNSVLTRVAENANVVGTTTNFIPPIIMTPQQLLPASSLSSQVINEKDFRYVTKRILYRTLLRFEYYHELSPQQIMLNGLDTSEVGRTYYHAVVISNGVRVCLINDSANYLFPYWSDSLKSDIFTLLKDLKEYHFSSWLTKPTNQIEDIRTQVLYWLFKTASNFSSANLIFDTVKSECAACSKIDNYNRLPCTQLIKAIKPSILNLIRNCKENLV